MTAIDSADWRFDHLDPELAPRLHETFAQLRRRCPVTHTDRHDGYWAVLSHEAIQRAALDPVAFSSRDGLMIPHHPYDGIQPPVNMDPPEHTAYRKILQPHFTRHAMARYEPLLRELVRERIDELVAAGEADLVPTLAKYLPALAIVLILGLPPEEAGRLQAVTESRVVTAASGDKAAAYAATREMSAYLAGRLREQRESGRETLMRTLADARVDGRPLTELEQANMIRVLFTAGHETTINSLGVMLYHLAAEPGLRERLRADAALVPSMVDECLRLEAPLIGIARTVRGDREFDGQQLRDGERVLLVLAAGNRDETVFEAPDEFRCPRPRGGNLAFGQGVHRCVGEHLALLEMCVVAEEILPHDYDLAPGYRPAWRPGYPLRNITTLPVTFR